MFRSMFFVWSFVWMMIYVMALTPIASAEEDEKSENEEEIEVIEIEDFEVVKVIDPAILNPPVKTTNVPTVRKITPVVSTQATRVTRVTPIMKPIPKTALNPIQNQSTAINTTKSNSK